MANPLRGGLRRLVTGLVVLGVALAVAAGVAWQGQQAFADRVLSPAVDHVVVQRGDGLNRVVARLREAGIDEGADLRWQVLARQLGAAGKIKAGEYALEEGITPRLLLERMRDGKVVQHRVTVVEGWNIRQVRAALARARPLVQTLEGVDDAALMEALGRPGLHPEGRFLPETYHYTRGESDRDVLARALAAMDRELARAWEGRAGGLPLQSPDELLTLASIVEKETGLASERPQIAGVFVRRLRMGMRLQTDPTVIYGLGEAYDGNLRRVHLTTDTPYNTYTRAGLPPTPIAMPGRDALQAAAHPADGDALYFVAVGDGSGAHRFSATYGEHQQAVADYLKRLRRARAESPAHE